MSGIKKVKTFEERVIENGGYLIYTSDEPCYTCGHKKYYCYAQKTDGRIEIVKTCLNCAVRCPTAANRKGD